MATKPKSGQTHDRKAQLVAVRKAFSRLRSWASEHGLELTKVPCGGGGLSRITFDVIFDRAAALALATRIRPRLSHRALSRVGEDARGSARVGPVSREGPSEQLMTLKSAAALIDLNAEVLRRKLDAPRPPIPLIRLDDRVVRVRRRDVLAWIERSERRGAG